MTGQGHEEYEQGVASYLLGAMPELEARIFERHLMGCATCRDDLERLRVVVEALPRSVDPIEPPPHLRAALMDAVGREAAAQPEGDGSRNRLTRLRLPGLPRLSLPRLQPVAVGMGVAVVVAAAGGFVVARSTDGAGERTVSAQVALPTGRGTLTIPGEGRSGAILNVHGLPPTEEGEAYQLWVQRDGQVSPNSIFRVHAKDGSGAAAVAGSLENADAVLVTREAESGVLRPSEPPVITIPIEQ